MKNYLPLALLLIISNTLSAQSVLKGIVLDEKSGPVEAASVNIKGTNIYRITDAKGQFSIWITDDERHLPVNVRVKTEYGTFDIRLKRVLNNPPR